MWLQTRGLAPSFPSVIQTDELNWTPWPASQLCSTVYFKVAQVDHFLIFWLLLQPPPPLKPCSYEPTSQTFLGWEGSTKDFEKCGDLIIVTQTTISQTLWACQVRQKVAGLKMERISWIIWVIAGALNEEDRRVGDNVEWCENSAGFEAGRCHYAKECGTFRIKTGKKASSPLEHQQGRWHPPKWFSP